MKLNHKNYFSSKNKLLSSHKIKDYLLSPAYYYEKHVLHTIEEEPSDAMIVGTMTETIIMYGKNKLNRNFKVVQRRSKEENGKRYTEVTQTMYEDALTMANRIMNTTAYKELNDFERQVILQTDKLCGMVDFLKIDGDQAAIVDLKTARSIDDRKYFYQSLDLGYWVQAGCYVKLVKSVNPEVKTVDFYHLAVEKDSKNINKVKTFKFADMVIDEYVSKIDKLIEEINTRTDWAPADASFKTPVVLGIKPATAEPMTEAEWEEI